MSDAWSENAPHEAGPRRHGWATPDPRRSGTPGVAEPAGRGDRLGAGGRPTGGRGPWPGDGAALLVELLLDIEPLARRDTRYDLLEQMDRAEGPYPYPGGGYAVGVPERADARGHLRALVRAVEQRPDPARGLRALCGGVRELAPYDRASAWLELAAHGLSGAAPLDAARFVPLVRALRPVTGLPAALAPTPAQLARHVPFGVPGTALLTGDETLPELLLRLSDLRGDQGPGPLLRFLSALAADRELPAYGQLAPLRALLAAQAAHHPGTMAAEATPAGTLIVQIRVEALDPEHVSDARYELRGAYYRRPPDGGPLVRLGSLPPSDPLRLSELADAGSRRLASWAALAREVRGAAASGGVRVEFLLPKPLLGHHAELWSAGASRTPLGHNHPVVVRSLERYSDPWLDPEPWRRRWRRLCEDEGEGMGHGLGVAEAVGHGPGEAAGGNASSSFPDLADGGGPGIPGCGAVTARPPDRSPGHEPEPEPGPEHEPGPARGPEPDRDPQSEREPAHVPGPEREPGPSPGPGPGPRPGPGSDPLARIAWPPLADLQSWLRERPDSACLGLTEPYDDLGAAVREAVHDALFMEGVPVLVWRRDHGDPHDIVTALRPHAPARLRDLPRSVHLCRRNGRTAGAHDVRNNITLLWDDPECVDEDQDLPFAGMP